MWGIASSRPKPDSGKHMFNVSLLYLFFYKIIFHSFLFYLPIVKTKSFCVVLVLAMKSSRFHSQKYFPVSLQIRLLNFNQWVISWQKCLVLFMGLHACVKMIISFFLNLRYINWLVQLIMYVINLMCIFSLTYRQPSVDGDVYRNGDHHISALDSFPLRRHYTPLLPPAGPIRDPRGSPPKYSSLESHDAPLNLSLSSSSLPSSSSAFSTQISRPSVITCAPTATEKTSHYSNVSPPHTPHAVASPKSRQIISGERKGLNTWTAYKRKMLVTYYIQRNFKRTLF